MFYILGRVNEWLHLGSSTVGTFLEKVKAAIMNVLDPGRAADGTSTPRVSPIPEQGHVDKVYLSFQSQTIFQQNNRSMFRLQNLACAFFY